MLNNIIMTLAVQQSRSKQISVRDRLTAINQYFKICMGLGYSINKTTIMWIDNVSLESLLIEENNND
ncbi:MAG: hypothetical protein RR929_00130 [Erysipelotrichaceae bacterium]